MISNMSAPQFQTASVVKRMMAYSIDFFIISVLTIGPMIAVLYSYLTAKTEMASYDFSDETAIERLIAWSPIVIMIVWLIVLHLYLYLAESMTGRTLGKKFFKLRVVDAKTLGPITRQQAFIRESMRWTIDLGLVFPAVLSMISDQNRQRVGDKAAKTLVIQE